MFQVATNSPCIGPSPWAPEVATNSSHSHHCLLKNSNLPSKKAKEDGIIFAVMVIIVIFFKFKEGGEVCIVERLFSSSLVALVELSNPRKLRVCHFKVTVTWFLCHSNHSWHCMAVYTTKFSYLKNKKRKNQE